MNDTDGTYYDVCKTAKLEYFLSGLESLTQLLEVVEDISAETGMGDWIMTHHGIRMKYDWTDAKAVIKGAMSEESYIERNRLPPGCRLG